MQPKHFGMVIIVIVYLSLFAACAASIGVLAAFCIWGSLTFFVLLTFFVTGLLVTNSWSQTCAPFREFFQRRTK